MALRRRQVGTGITARSVVDVEWDDEDTDIRTYLSDTFTTVRNEAWFEGLESQARNLLARLGLPGCWGLYRRHGANWTRALGSDALRLFVIGTCCGLRPQFIESDLKGDELEDIAAGQFGDDSKAYFAARILSLTYDLRLATAHGYSAFAQQQSYRLGRLVTELSLKLRWERAALSGARRQEALATARDRGNDRRLKTARAWRARAQAVAAEIWARNPTLSAAAVSYCIRSSSDVLMPGDRAVRGAIAHLRPKKPGSAH
jgi:hypothetical protein